MNDFGDIFTKQTTVTPEPELQETPFEKEKWAADKKQEREKVFGIINDAAVQLTSSDEALKAYLDVQSRFDRYSVGNALLISVQMPEATKLADFDTWVKEGAHIEEGSTAITILEPGKEYKKEDGNTGVFWNTKKVFDVSQTNARQEAPKVSLDARVMLRALINNAPCKLELSPTLSGPFNAIYNPDKKEIVLRQGLDAPTIFRDLSQELVLAHMNAEQFLWAWLRSELLEPREFKCEPTSIYYEWLKPRIDARLNGREYKELVKTPEKPDRRKKIK